MTARFQELLPDFVLAIIRFEPGFGTVSPKNHCASLLEIIVCRHGSYGIRPPVPGGCVVAGRSPHPGVSLDAFGAYPG